MMKAVVITKYGPPEGLQLTEVERPTPEGNEVLIKIHATTVTFGDAMLRTFTGIRRFVFGRFFDLGIGKILGHELAGEIESVGQDVARFRKGDQVFASTGTKAGAYAEYICLPEDGYLTTKPSNLTYEEAAAVPVGANTALDILRKGDIQRGQEVLVYGASGSVGTYAVQLAKHLGAEVTGVCSAKNFEMVKSIGADKVIDYTKEDFTRGGETYDVIFDAVRKISESQGKRALKKTGTYLSVASPTTEKAEDLVFLGELIEAGEMRPVIDRRFPMDQIVEAHRYVDQGHKKGNVVIIVAESSKTKQSAI